MSRQLSRLQKTADHLNADAGVETEKARAALSKLAGMLVTHYSSGDFGKLAAFVGSISGDAKYAGMFGDLAGYLPEYVMSCDVKIANVVDDRTVGVELGLLETARSCTEKAAALKAEARKLTEEYKQASETFGSLVTGHYRRGSSSNPMEKYLADGPGFGSVKQAGKGGSVLPSMFGFAAVQSATDAIGRRYDEMQKRPKRIDKGISDANKRFQNMEREMILADLINNDPYLSEEDPETIARYYGNFINLSPELSGNKEVVRSVLRQAVHNGGGGYSPFDAGSFVDAEKTLKEIRGTLPPRKVQGAAELLQLEGKK
jgi:hypothetical protein